MSNVLAPTSPAVSLRRFLARLWGDPDTRSIEIGIVAVLLVHLLIWLLSPYLLRMHSGPSVLRPHSSTRQFNIVLTPDTFARPAPKPPAPKQFVETNPDAPENIPDKTNNFGAQNQQVAQVKPSAKSSDESERPAMEGKKDFQSTQIVSGQLEKHRPVVPVAPAPETAVTPPSHSAPRAEQNPLPGFEKKQGDNPHGYGTNVAEESENARPIPRKIEGEKGVPLVEGAMGMQPAIDPMHPRPRPMLVTEQQVRPAILAENPVGTKNIGRVIAINAKFNQYGLYLQRMADAVQLEFDRLVSEQSTYPPVGSYVVVHFLLDSHGNIPRFLDIENHSSDIGKRVCLSAIANRAPYGEWTDDMKATLNPNGEELVFTFYYQ